MAEYKLVCRMKPYIQPFERELALRELRQSTHARPVALRSEASDPVLYQVVTTTPPRRLIHSLAYWESVTNGRRDFTLQVKREATVAIARNGITPGELAEALPFENDVPLPNRRCLRYGPHGIHEYRGKFFPQLVRSLLNIADLRTGSIILDPMCGSGTTAVESILRGYQARGLDINPLSVLMSRTKCDSLSIAPEELASAFDALQTKLVRRIQHKSLNTRWLNSLPADDAKYLRGWFAPKVLVALDQIMQCIQDHSSGPARSLFLMTLSNILRPMSWQKDEDLRIRKEIWPVTDCDPMGEYLIELGKSVKTMLAFLYNEGPAANSNWRIDEGDSRNTSKHLRDDIGRVNAIITSPPYATALPYLDTDRLSLCYLGLLSRVEHRKRDIMMVGNREVTDSQRRKYWDFYEENKAILPMAIQKVIEKVEQLNRSANVGFRRRNLPALLAKYFLDMRTVCLEMRTMLRPGSPAFVVIGNNHTIAGGHRIDIETNSLLGELGESVGLQLEESLSMEMLISRDIFKKNTGTAENILFFRKA